MESYQINKVGVFSLAKFQSILLGMIGVVFGLVYSIGGLIIDIIVTLGWISSTETPGLSYGTILAFGAIVGMPVLFAIAGFLLGLFEALLFNFFSKWIKGVQLKFIK